MAIFVLLCFVCFGDFYCAGADGWVGVTIDVSVHSLERETARTSGGPDGRETRAETVLTRPAGLTRISTRNSERRGGGPGRGRSGAGAGVSFLREH